MFSFYQHPIFGYGGILLSCCSIFNDFPLLFTLMPFKTNLQFWEMEKKSIILEILWVKNSEQLIQENNSLRNSTFSIILQRYVDDFLGPEEINDTCGKTVHVGTIDRGFILLGHVFAMRASCLPLTVEVWVQSEASLWKL